MAKKAGRKKAARMRAVAETTAIAAGRKASARKAAPAINKESSVRQCIMDHKEPAKRKLSAEDERFLEYVERKVRNTINKNGLFSRKNRIAMAVSGGKDSTVCLYILKKLGYEVEAITIDVQIGCYTDTNLANIKKFCEEQGVKLHVISLREEFGMSLCYMRDALKEKGEGLSSCMICGTLKRYLLNKYSRKLGFDRLATGHNMDDEAQTFVMNLFKNEMHLAQRQGPITRQSSGLFVTRVKPMYNISENEIIRYSRLRAFPVHYGICPCSEDAYRRDYLNMLDDFEKKYPSVKYNILHFHERMMEFVNAAKGTEMIPEKNNKDVSGKRSDSPAAVGICESCGEPASKSVCKVCQLLAKIKS